MLALSAKVTHVVKTFHECTPLVDRLVANGVPFDAKDRPIVARYVELLAAGRESVIDAVDEMRIGMGKWVAADVISSAWLVLEQVEASQRILADLLTPDANWR